MVASALVPFGCLAALAVVAIVKDADALSTVAVVLAILAFAAPLIVYGVQAGECQPALLLAQYPSADGTSRRA